MSASTPFAAPTILAPDSNTRTPKLKLPPGSCDCHAHVFGPQDKYPYAPKRAYTPHLSPIADYLRMLNTIGVERAVLVQSISYGTDNSAMLDALSTAGVSLRGIAVVDDQVTDRELERLHGLGVRGLRIRSLESALNISARIAPLGWHLQIRVDSSEFGEVERLLEKLPVDVIIDHIGEAPVDAGLDGHDFRILLKMVATGHCWVKLSAPMRMSKQRFPYEDVTPYVRALVEEAPERMVWATDWPHTQMIHEMPNDGDLVDLLSVWVPDTEIRNKILVQNPALLYSF